MAAGIPSVRMALGGSFRHEVASRSPLAWYRFAEQSGYATIEDSSGQAHDGTLTGSVTQAVVPHVAEGGRAALFHGSSSEYVDLRSAALGSIGTTWTIDAWLKPTSSFVAGDILSDAGAAASIEYLVVGAGGGGGSSAGGGGGGGDVLSGTDMVSPGAYAVTIGAGGTGSTRGGGLNGVAGGSSAWNSHTAVGGGGGGTDGAAGSSGANGGGGGGFESDGTPPHTQSGGTGTAGFAGGTGSRTTGNHANGGGGGGNGAVGANATTSAGGNGGAGTSSSISGSAVTYGGGGGGGANGAVGDTAGTGTDGGGNGSASGAGATATANRGGGGGGAAYGSGNGGAGAAGVVIVRYLTGAVTASGGTTSTSGSYTIHTFTTSGTFTITAIAIGTPTIALRLGTDGKVSMFYSGAEHKTSTALTLDAWVHVRVTCTAGSGTFYLDEVASGTFTSCPALYVGALGRGLYAYVDELALFTTALSVAEGAALHAAAAWTDVSADVSGDAAVEWAWGIEGSGPLDRLAAPSSARFALMNFADGTRPEGYYAPLHPSVRPGFTFGRLCQIALADSSDVDFIHFTGRLTSIDPQPTPSGSLTHVTLADLMTDFHEAKIRDIALEQDETEDTLLRKIVRALPVTAQPLALQLDAGLDVHPYAFDKLAGGQVVAGVVGAIMRSVLGYWSCGPDGIMRYESRDTRPSVASSIDFDASDASLPATKYTSLRIPTDLSGVYNVIQATYHPIKPGSTVEVCWSQEGTAPPIEPGQTITIRGAYFDPSEKGKRIGILSPVTPLVASTDYAANAAEDGSGTDRTASCQVVSVAAYASNWVAQFKNNHTAKIYLTKAQIRGTALRDNSPVAIEVRTEQPYGERRLEFDMPFQTDGVLAQQLADYLLTQVAERASQVTAVDFRPTVDDALLDALAAAQVGLCVTVTEPVTGVSARTAYVQRISGAYLRGQLDAAFGLQVLYPFEFIGPPAPTPGFAATGGTVTNVGGYTIHTFTTGGTFTVTSGAATVDVLVVAGGGGGGGDLGGGGGGGGVKATTAAVTATAYTVTVGAGGAAGTSGSDSSALGVTAHGGGAGGDNGTAGDAGGSGGGGGADSGAGGTGTSGEGYRGGTGGLEDESGAGGGGAGAVGGNGGYPGRGGNGGAGLPSSISGSTAYYGGGGGGDGYASSGGGGLGGGGDAGSDGTANTGGGGGASSSGGKAGGSGIVIIRYAT